MPEKADLKPRIFGRIERDGYSVEKVLIQPSPGFYLGGNLYRPLGRGTGPFPAILNPHGHWDAGRLADTPTGSVIARCIQFARMGMVAFAYDMTGYVDTIQFAPKDADGAIRVANYHTLQQKLFRAETNQLWNLSLLGVQTWNSVRALDFVASLPDVDARRIGCTGASGGGSQTFLLAAIDNRIAVSAPIVMVSCSMQGGCWCENAPALRVDFSNMEYSAAFAPKPQILVAASGDWTKETMTVEGPAIAGVYSLLGAKDRLRYMRFDFPHNYNQTTREAVYAFLAQHLLGQPAVDLLPEPPYQAEKPEDLKAFPDGRIPEDAVSEAEFVGRWISERRKGVAARVAARTPSAEALRLWRHTLLINPAEPVVGEAREGTASGNLDRTVVAIGRPGFGDRVPGVAWNVRGKIPKGVVVWIHPDGLGALEAEGRPAPRVRELAEAGFEVLAVQPFQTGPGADRSVVERSPFKDFHAGYNRTVLQQRVRDVVSATTYARIRPRDGAAEPPVVVVGEGKAALWAALAAPMADALVLDPVGVDRTDAEWIRPEDFVPGIHLLGDAEGALRAAGEKPVARTGSVSVATVQGLVRKVAQRTGSAVPR